MKKLFAPVAFCFAFTIAVSAQQNATWKEMEAFHDVMGSTFHPAEAGNLQPVKKRSAEMLEKATAWKNATAPEGYDKKAVKASLKRLVKGAKHIHKMVKENAPDKELVEELSNLHDIFHGIMEKSQPGDHH